METKKIPGPEGNTFFKGAKNMQRSPMEYLQEMDKNYPGIANWKLLHLNVVHITDPKLIRVILQTNQKQYVKNTAYKHLKLILGNGLVTSEGDLWRRQRKLIQPSFHKQSIYNMFNTMLSCTDEMVEEWKVKLKSKNEIDISQEMMAITLQIIGQTMLSKDVKADAKSVAVSLSYLLKAVDQKATRALNIPLWVPIPSNFRFKKEEGCLMISSTESLQKEENRKKKKATCWICSWNRPMKIPENICLTYY